MDTAKVFVTGRSQAVRLPKEYRFDADEVCIARVGELVILYSRKKGWDVLEAGIRHFTEDFLADRGQPAKADQREAI
jgi:antitoxin VapB